LPLTTPSTFYKRLCRKVKEEKLLSLLKESFRRRSTSLLHPMTQETGAYGPAGALAMGIREKDFLRMALSDMIVLRNLSAPAAGGLGHVR